jgi:3-hydroxyisobutyrate dehydrogenase
VTEIAVLGTGTMGAAIARWLLGTGHRVTVWNRTQARVSNLADADVGAATPARAVAGADLAVVGPPAGPLPVPDPGAGAVDGREQP